jgi:hypothetical protein
MKSVLKTARGAAPYLLVEILLPGGTLIALLLWIFRNRSNPTVQPLLWMRKITGLIPSPLR